MILSQADVIRAAALTGTPTSDQYAEAADIQSAIDVVVESIVGPITSQSYRTSPRSVFVLPFRFDTITSVTVTTGGVDTVVPAAEYDVLDGRSGILRAAAGYSPWSTADYVTIAVAGIPAPASVKVAAMMLARHWWQLTQNGGRGAWADEVATPAGGGIPRAVRELLATTPTMPGFG